MWTFLITVPLILISGIVFYFLLRRNQKSDPPLILQKYDQLIMLLKGAGHVQSEKTGTRNLSFRKLQGEDAWTYFISEVDERLIVAWKLDSRTHGNRGKEWSFSSAYDQSKMFEEIESDLKKYNRELFRERK